jgi:hypothetical protein
MHKIKTFALAVAVASSAQAAIVTVVTDPTAFAASLEPGSETQDFNLFDGYNGGSWDVSVPSFTITATTSGGLGLYANASAGFSTNNPRQSLFFTFSGANLPTAVAFNAFLTDSSFNFLPGEISVAVNGASVATYNYTTFAQSFRGINSDVPITSIGFSGTNTGAYVTVDNLVVGNALSAIPEPSSALATGILLASALLLRRRDSEALALAQGSAAPGSLNS